MNNGNISGKSPQKSPDKKASKSAAKKKVTIREDIKVTRFPNHEAPNQAKIQGQDFKTSIAFQEWAREQTGSVRNCAPALRQIDDERFNPEYAEKQARMDQGLPLIWEDDD
eukprot:scpid105375/ scgid34789/ 